MHGCVSPGDMVDNSVTVRSLVLPVDQYARLSVTPWVTQLPWWGDCRMECVVAQLTAQPQSD